MGAEEENTRRDPADVLVVTSPRWTDDATARSGPAYRGPAGRAPHHLVAPTHSILRLLLPTALITCAWAGGDARP